MRRLPDPRVVFAMALFFSTFGVIIRDTYTMAALLALTFLCALSLGVDFKRLFGRLKRLWQIVIAVALMQSIFAPSGAVLIPLWGVPVLTAGGLLKGLLVLLRIVVFITGGAMISLYPSRALIQGMVQIRLPYEAAFMVSIGVRFVPQLAEELRDSLTALQLRGVVIEELKLRKRLRLYSYLLLPVVAASLQNARELAMSMEMRAFRAMKERSSYYTLALGRWDVVLLCVILLLAAMTAVIIWGVH